MNVYSEDEIEEMGKHYEQCMEEKYKERIKQLEGLLFRVISGSLLEGITIALRAEIRKVLNNER